MIIFPFLVLVLILVLVLVRRHVVLLFSFFFLRLFYARFFFGFLTAAFGSRFFFFLNQRFLFGLRGLFITAFYDCLFSGIGSGSFYNALATCFAFIALLGAGSNS